MVAIVCQRKVRPAERLEVRENSSRHGCSSKMCQHVPDVSPNVCRIQLDHEKSCDVL